MRKTKVIFKKQLTDIITTIIPIELNIQMKIFNPREPHQLLMIYGGYEHGLPSCTIKTFDLRAGMWYKVQFSDKYPRVYHATVVSSVKDVSILLQMRSGLAQ